MVGSQHAQRQTWRGADQRRMSIPTANCGSARLAAMPAMVMAMIDQSAHVTDQVLELGRQWANAERAGDADALSPLLADEFLLVGPLGFLLDKTQYLGSRRSGDLRHESLVWEDVRVRVYNDAAVAVGIQTQRSTYRGRDASGRFRVTLVAVRYGDRWTVVGLHYSPIAQPPEGRTRR
jgi:ketosteroid isomerase-like protein